MRPEESTSTRDHVAALLSALDKMPGYEGISFRGRPADVTFRTPGQVVVSRALIATSQDIRVATENFSCESIYAVVGNAGRSIAAHSQHPDEKEIVFRPSTMFLVVESWEAHGVGVTLVEQLDPNRDVAERPRRRVDELRPLIDKHVAMALRRGDVAVHSPGKFAGDID